MTVRVSVIGCGCVGVPAAVGGGRKRRRGAHWMAGRRSRVVVRLCAASVYVRLSRIGRL